LGVARAEAGERRKRVLARDSKVDGAGAESRGHEGERHAENRNVSQAHDGNGGESARQSTHQQQWREQEARVGMRGLETEGVGWFGRRRMSSNEWNSGMRAQYCRRRRRQQRKPWVALCAPFVLLSRRHIGKCWTAVARAEVAVAYVQCFLSVLQLRKRRHPPARVG